MPKLTKRLIEAPVPEGQSKPIHLWDDEVRGFGVRILPSGVRRYLVKYRTSGGGRSAPQRWYMIGTHGGITLDQARALAQQALAAVARGDDPQSNKFALRAAPTMAELWERYKTDHLPRKKDRSSDGDRQMWRDHISSEFGGRKIHEVTRDSIDRLHKRMADRPYQANRVISLLSKLFNLAERWGMRSDGTNPCRHVEKYAEQRRERFLSQDELSRLGDALRTGLAAQTETPYMVAAIQLLLLTGARVSEILTAQWEWVDWDRRTIQLPDSKTGRRALFLSEPAIEVLQGVRELITSKSSPYIIKGHIKDHPLVNLAKPWRRIIARAGLADIRIHDLRHTAASIGGAQGMNLPVIGRLLGHTQASTTNRYAHVGIDPARAAAEKIGAVVSSALAMKAEKESAAPIDAQNEISAVGTSS